MSQKILMNIGKLLENTDIITEKHHITSGSVIVPHWHDYFEFEIIVSGRAEHIYNGKKYIIQRGCAYLLSYCDFHSFKVTEDICLINIRFNETLVPTDLLHRITLKPNKLIFTFSENETCNILSDIERLNEEISNPEILGNIIISSVISKFIVMLIRHSSDETIQAVPMIIQKAYAYINTHFRDNLSLKLLADNLSVSVNYLGTLFNKHLSTSFNDYLNNVRLKYACGLLISSDLSVKEIAYASGYSSTEYFAYIFKKQTGMSPGKYRSAASGSNS